MIIDAISDLHGHLPDLEGGDLLIVGGDCTARDSKDEWIDFLSWLSLLPYTKIILVAGNHDNRLFNVEVEIPDEIVCLTDEGTEVNGFKIWGTPWTKTFHGINPDCMAFTKDHESQLENRFLNIPEGLDILVCHGPMWGILDEVSGKHVGSFALRSIVDRVKPRVLVCGHIHEGYGYCLYKNWGFDTHCYNVSLVNGRYKPVNAVTRIRLP